MNLLSERLAHVYSLRSDLEGERGQTGFVKASGASKSVVNQWFSGGIKSIDIRYALKIERELGISHIWLMTGDGEVEVHKISASTWPFRISKDRFDRLPPEEKKLAEVQLEQIIAFWEGKNKGAEQKVG